LIAKIQDIYLPPDTVVVVESDEEEIDLTGAKD
jgi:hypothetical protein